MTRSVGRARSGREFGLHDHVCWVYDDTDAFVSVSQQFVADGLSQGLQVGYLGHTVHEGLRRFMREQSERQGRDDAVFVRALDDYPADGVVSPRDQVETFRRATESAVAAGFRGLRVVAEATELVRTRDQLDAFVRYEHLIDGHMQTWPFSAMCAFDRRVLGDAVGDLACVHPICNEGASGFGLFATAGATVGVRGDLDYFERDRFVRTLQRILPTDHGRDVCIDASHLTFADHHALVSLRQHVHAYGGSVTIRTPQPHGLARIVDVLGLSPEIRIERVA